MQTRYDGKFAFTTQTRSSHASWCYLKVIQAGDAATRLTEPAQPAVVIFSKAYDNPGTSIEVAARHLATQVVDMFRLEPAKTTFIEYMPPEDPMPQFEKMWQEDAAQMLERLTSPAFGPSAEKYEQIQFEWRESKDYEKPKYQAFNPQWTPPITPIEVARMIQRLEETTL